VARWLIDLSAWARRTHPDAKLRWEELVTGDRLLCHPVFAVEMLHNAINPKMYGDLRWAIEKGFDWAWPDEETAHVALAMQERMATTATAGQRVKTADLLTAALAVQQGVGVLHHDGDYDLIRDLGGQPFDAEWLPPKGSADPPGFP
jgi:predicted nucleic acid-binding protein